VEKLIYSIITSRFKRYLVIAVILLSLGGSVMMFPTKLVLAKMLPGKSANTFTIYVDTPVDSTIKQTQSVTECVVNELKKEREVLDMETYLGQASSLSCLSVRFTTISACDFRDLKALPLTKPA